MPVLFFYCAYPCAYILFFGVVFILLVHNQILEVNTP
jgi:hypothetical protein